MKRRGKLIYILLLLLLALCFHTVCHASYMPEYYSLMYFPEIYSTVYVVEDVALTETPGGVIVDALAKGDETTIYEYDWNMEWARVDGGWCYAGYLSSALPTVIDIKMDSEECLKYIGYTNTLIAQVPEEILFELASAGYEFMLTTSDIGKDNLYLDGTDSPDSTGVTVYTGVWCKSYVEAEPYAIYYSVVHEIGHAFSWMCGEPCMEEEFQYVFEEEGQLADTPHHAENVQEYFAACFRDYIEEGASFFVNRPISYEYIQDILSPYENSLEIATL